MALILFVFLSQAPVTALDCGAGFVEFKRSVGSALYEETTLQALWEADEHDPAAARESFKADLQTRRQAKDDKEHRRQAKERKRWSKQKTQRPKKLSVPKAPPKARKTPMEPANKAARLSGFQSAVGKKKKKQQKKKKKKPHLIVVKKHSWNSRRSAAGAQRHQMASSASSPVWQNRRKTMGARSRRLRFGRKAASRRRPQQYCPTPPDPSECRQEPSVTRSGSDDVELQNGIVSVSLVTCDQQSHVGVCCIDGKESRIHHFNQNGVHQQNPDDWNGQLVLGEELFGCSRVDFDRAVKELRQCIGRYQSGSLVDLLLLSATNNYESLFT